MATDFRQLEEFRDKIQALADDKCSKFCDDCTKELTGRLLAKVIRRTPVGVAPEEFNGKEGKKKRRETNKVKGEDGKTKSFLTADAARYQQYWAGYVGGTLRRGWTGGQQVSNVSAYAQGLPVNVMSNAHRINIINQVEYATYVEYGHRQTPGRYVPALGKRLKQSWVKGQFMMTDSVKELDAQAGNIVQRKLNKFLRDEGLG